MLVRPNDVHLFINLQKFVYQTHKGKPAIRQNIVDFYLALVDALEHINEHVRFFEFSSLKRFARGSPLSLLVFFSCFRCFLIGPYLFFLLSLSSPEIACASEISKTPCIIMSEIQDCFVSQVKNFPCHFAFKKVWNLVSTSKETHLCYYLLSVLVLHLMR